MKKPVEFMKQHGIADDEIWEVRRGGTWAVKHSALERIASTMRIKFSTPVMIEHSVKDKVAVMCVTGRNDETGQEEWSIGEAAPYNNKNEYPFAMAEKRAKDRVILKLLQAHGQVYSDAEADEFRQNGDAAESASEAWGNRRGAELKRATQWTLEEQRANAPANGKPSIVTQNDVVWDETEERAPLASDFEVTTGVLKASYLDSARDYIRKATKADDLRAWWFSSESKMAREDFDLTVAELKDLSQFCKAQIDKLAGIRR